MNFARRLWPLYALLAGAIHACSFAPWDLPWLQVLALATLFALASRATSARSAVLLGFAFGMGWFGVGISWVYVSMHVYGLMPAVFGGRRDGRVLCVSRRVSRARTRLGALAFSGNVRAG